MILSESMPLRKTKRGHRIHVSTLQPLSGAIQITKYRGGRAIVPFSYCHTRISAPQEWQTQVVPRVTYDVVTVRLLTVLGSTKDRSRYENHNMTPETIVKARRTRLTIAQKIQVGHVLQLGNPNHAVMPQFNISERTVRNALFLHYGAI